MLLRLGGFREHVLRRQLEDYMCVSGAIDFGAANDRPDSRWRVHLGLGYTQIGILFLYSLRVLRQLLLAQKHSSWGRLFFVPSDNLWILEHGECICIPPVTPCGGHSQADLTSQ